MIPLLTISSRMLLRSLFFLSVLPVFSTKKTKSSEIIHIDDLKDWKKELRTKNNVLALFSKDSKKPSKLHTILDDVSISMRGLATVISVDCSDASKLCKKLKISPKPHLLYHYSNGEFNKEYDRKDTLQSMESFLKDPKGDLPWVEEDAAQDVVHLDFAGFKRFLKKSDDPILVMFYAPWCGHCKRLKPEFNNAATQMKGKVSLVGVDADGAKGAGATKEYNVTSFPTILYFEKGIFQFKFSGERTASGIVTWLENPTPETVKDEVKEVPWAEEDPNTSVAHLTTDTFKPFLADHDSVLVMFYAPWCGHCKAMKPEFDRAAAALLEEEVTGKLAAVDVTTNRELGDEFGVKGFPTVIYFKNGNKTFEHPGLRKEGDITSFMKNPQEPPPPAPEESSWSEVESAVVHPVGVDFERTVKRKKHVLVMFYAPWCGHCKKAKPEFTAAADQLVENNKVMFVAVDCTSDPNKAVCSAYGVKSYPTLVYVSYGSNPHKYTGGRDQQSFVTAMSSDDPTRGSMSPLDTPTTTQESAEWKSEFVVEVTDPDKFISETSPTFMLYYRKGCTTCKSVQDAFAAAAQLLQFHSVTFSAFQCPPTSGAAAVAHCGTGQPRIILHESADKHRIYGHSLTSSRDMYNFISSLKDEL